MDQKIVNYFLLFGCKTCEGFDCITNYELKHPLCELCHIFKEWLYIDIRKFQASNSYIFFLFHFSYQIISLIYYIYIFLSLSLFFSPEVSHSTWICIGIYLFPKHSMWMWMNFQTTYIWYVIPDFWKCLLHPPNPFHELSPSKRLSSKYIFLILIKF